MIAISPSLSPHMFFSWLLDRLYPPCCLGCEALLDSQLPPLCTHYWGRLPFSVEEMSNEKEVSTRLGGYLPLVRGAALFPFIKGSYVQRIVHKIKYTNRSRAAYQLGVFLGYQWRYFPETHTIDKVISVPLHPRRQSLRGYNQSQCIAEGISKALGIPSYSKALHRIQATAPQKGKTTDQRWRNVTNVFTLCTTSSWAGSHVLLVDDVLTTGATLTACAQALVAQGVTKVSVAVLSVALSNDSISL